MAFQAVGEHRLAIMNRSSLCKETFSMRQKPEGLSLYIAQGKRSMSYATMRTCALKGQKNRVISPR
ncbi:MAG: hypothetical protein IKZ67_04020 [Paludibacteraceae bacterium]|nr:hypothetical protein [Paludibacteraceae bacterium]